MTQKCCHCGTDLMGPNDVFEPGDGDLIGLGLKAMYDRSPAEFAQFFRDMFHGSKVQSQGTKIGDTITVRRPARYSA